MITLATGIPVVSWNACGYLDNLHVVVPGTIKGSFAGSELAVSGKALILMAAQASLAFLQLSGELVLASLQAALALTQGSAD